MAAHQQKKLGSTPPDGTPGVSYAKKPPTQSCKMKAGTAHTDHTGTQNVLIIPRAESVRSEGNIGTSVNLSSRVHDPQTGGVAPTEPGNNNRDLCEKHSPTNG